MIAASDLRQRVTIQARTEAESHGSYTETWPTVVRSRVSSRVRPLHGRDLERARQIDPRISHEVVLRYWQRYQADLDGGRVRLVYHPTSDNTDDRTFEVVSPPVDVDEAHREIRVLCREVAL